MRNHAALREQGLQKLSSKSLGTFLTMKWKSPKPQRKTWNKTPLDAATEPPPWLEPGSKEDPMDNTQTIWFFSKNI